MILPIVEHPDPLLRQVAAPVSKFGAQVTQLVNDMVDTLQHTGGIGLSATQVGKTSRIFIADLSDNGVACPECYINPQIMAKSRSAFVQESCLSIPGVSGNVVRSTRIRVSAQDIHGVPFERSLEGMHAVCVQHEIDHLNGVLFIDRLSKFAKLCRKLRQPGSTGVLQRLRLMRS